MRIRFPDGFQGLVKQIESMRAELNPSVIGPNPDGSLAIELTADLPDPESGPAFAHDLLLAAAEEGGYSGRLPVTVELWALEEPPVKPGEPDPILVTIDLAFCVHLQNATYPIAFGGQVFQLTTEKVWRNSINSSTDDTVSEEPIRFETGQLLSPPIGSGVMTSIHTGTNIEIKEDPHGRYRFSRITIRLDQIQPGDLSDVPKVVKQILPILNRFLDVYRFATGRAYLPPVLINDIEVAEVFRPRTREGQHLFLFGRGYENALVNEPRTVHERVRGMLLTEDLIPLHAELLLTAKRLLAEGNSRQAVIEAIAALEVLVDRLLRKHLVERLDMSESDFGALMEKDGRALSDRMKKPLVRAINWSPASAQPELWNRWLAVNEVRRRIVHQGSQATEVQAAEAVAVASQLITLIEDVDAAQG